VRLRKKQEGPEGGFPDRSAKPSDRSPGDSIEEHTEARLRGNDSVPPTTTVDSSHIYAGPVAS